MSCNPCCCLKLKDAAISIGIWSTIYSLAQIALFAWQFSVLAQCQHVIMAQSNLQCDYYCPCVGASTSRTSAIIEGLFVIQILCLIAAFFLLFASLMMIYGVHTWSRFLLVPWMVTMCASILTSFAYCLIWWAGDVRDYWLLLTIVQMFGVFLNSYCFLVVIVFHRRMLVELEYYARRRKYDRFSRLPPQKTMEQGNGKMDGNDEESPGRKKETFPYKRPAPAQLAHQIGHLPTELGSHLPGHFGGEEDQKQRGIERQMYTTTLRRTPTEQRHIQKAVDSPKILPPHHHQIRSRSALEGPLQKRQFDEYREVPRRDKRRRQKVCHRDLSVHRFHCCHASKHCHCHRHSAESQNNGSSSSTSSDSALGEYSVGEMPRFGRRPSRKGRRSRKKRSREWMDRESSDHSEVGHTVHSQREYGNVGSLERRWRRQPREQFPNFEERRRRGGTLCQAKNGPTMNLPDSTSNTLPRVPQQILAPAPTAEGISVPQHIVIPPVQLGGRTSETLDTRAQRRYRINSEITVSYDPKDHQPHQNGPRKEPPEIPPRILLPAQSLSPHSAGYINLSTNAMTVSGGRREQTQQRQQLISMHSNV